MLKQSLKRSCMYFTITMIFMFFASNIWYPGYIITPFELLSFSDFVEMTLPTLLVAFCCFILHNKYEIELSLVCGMNTAKLFFSKAISIFVCTLAPTYVIFALFRFIPYDGDIQSKIPIFIPQDYKLYIAISLFVTFFFFFSLFCFFRVLTRNCYIPIFMSLFVYTYFNNLSKMIQKGAEDIRKSLVNPFISNYILGDTVPNIYAERIEGMEIMRHAWTYNRLGFFVVGVVLLILTYILLRRENLHKGFGD